MSTFYVDDSEIFTAVLKNIAFLVFATFAYGIAFGSLIGILSGISNKNSRLSELIVRLLISMPKPYKYGNGFNRMELERLSEVAKIEQASADWRGNFITLAVWGVILALLNWSMRNTDFNLTLSGFKLFIDNVPPKENALYLLFSWVVAVFFAVRFSFRICEYVSAFFSRESANRIMILACQEASNLLLDLKLTQKEKLSIGDKQLVGDSLGFRVIPEKDVRKLSYKKKYRFESKPNTFWFLLVDGKEKRRFKRVSREKNV